VVGENVGTVFDINERSVGAARVVVVGEGMGEWKLLEDGEAACSGDAGIRRSACS
jgi:hypothetical protein